MDSPTLRSVVADANVLLSAAIGGAAQRVFHETDIEVVTTEEVLDEVREYLVELAVENGRIVMEDTCARLREKDDIKEFYLGMKDAGVRGERRWKKKKTWR